jgi:hypothetical protein
MMIRYLIPALLLALPPAAFAADILTTWSAVTTDSAGAALPSPVSEYRVYTCDDQLLATVPGDATEYREVGGADWMRSGDSVCRRVKAYRAPFEGAAGDGVYTAIVPGQTTVTTSAVPSG